MLRFVGSRGLVRLDLSKRLFSSQSPLSWSDGSETIAQRLFEKFSTNLDINEVPVDPRGMKSPQMKRHLKEIGFQGPLTEVDTKLYELTSHWQRLYDDMVNGNIALPGREKAGPLTFAKVNDKECVKDLHDKDGRRLL